MNILLTNDDGIKGEGLSILHRHLVSTGLCEVVVIAPEEENSAISNAISIRKPLKLRRFREGWYSLNGTPTDCVHIGINHFLDKRPRFVISGINHGPNLGEDIIYSGTVGAAIEGAMNGVDSIAISLVLSGNGHFDTAGKVAIKILMKLLHFHGHSNPLILNVNVPDMPEELLKGFRITRMGSIRYLQKIWQEKDDGDESLIIKGKEFDIQSVPDSDGVAVREGYVSITPLTYDLTDLHMKEYLTSKVFIDQ